MTVMELGQVVLSKCGRDKGRYFIVVGIDINGKYVYLADGLLRKIENPKKKRFKHITAIYTNEEIKNKLVSCSRINNSDIKKCLSNLVRQNEIENSITGEEGG